MPHIEKTIESEEIFEGRVFRITVDKSRLENGAVHTREVVHHIGGAGVLALSREGEVAMVRQYRYGAGCETVEIPAGKLEPGEAPIATARRELMEEAGLHADKIEPFGSILPTCAYCTEVIHLFVATQLTQGQKRPDEDEFVDLFWLPLTQAVQWVMDGRITDAKTSVALLKADKLVQAGELKY